MRLKTGRKGKLFNDRELAAKVRTLTLEEIKKVLEQKDLNEFKKAVILKLASSILPRINEHSGQDGTPIAIVFDKSFNGNKTGATS